MCARESEIEIELTAENPEREAVLQCSVHILGGRDASQLEREREREHIFHFAKIKKRTLPNITHGAQQTVVSLFSSALSVGHGQVVRL